MAIYRAKRQTNFTMLSNVGLKDKRLSFKAKGILAYMLSLPDDWVFYETEIIKHATDGKQSLRSGLKELQETGYLVKHQSREKGKFSNVEWVISDEPNLDITTFVPSTTFTSTEKPTTEKPSTDNRPLLNTNNTKDLYIQNTDKDSPQSQKRYDDNSHYMKLAQRLLNHIQQRDPKYKDRNMQTWADDMRKLVELDKRSIEEVERVLDWSQQDTFWQTNILSPNKLRKHFSKLYQQCNAKQPINYTFTNDKKEKEYTEEEIAEFEKWKEDFSWE